MRAAAIFLVMVCALSGCQNSKSATEKFSAVPTLSETPIREKLVDDSFDLCELLDEKNASDLVGVPVVPLQKVPEATEIMAKYPAFTKRKVDHIKARYDWYYRCRMVDPNDADVLKQTRPYQVQLSVAVHPERFLNEGFSQMILGDTVHTVPSEEYLALQKTYAGGAHGNAKVPVTNSAGKTELERGYALGWHCQNMIFRLYFSPAEGEVTEEQVNYAWQILTPIISQVCGEKPKYYSNLRPKVTVTPQK